MSERDLKALLALVEKHLGTSWIEIADWLREQNGLDAIEQRLLVGDYAGVIQGVEAAARRFASEIHSQFVVSGRAQSEWLDSQLRDKLVTFDVMNPRAVQAAQSNELELVQGLTQENRRAVHQIIVEGTRSATNPRVMAQSIRDSIGLAPQQEAAVRSYRFALEQGNWGNALSRELSAGQSDRTVRRLQRDGGGLSNAQLDTMVERYRQNALTWRAETIARTESLRNVHAGLDEAIQQAVDRGDVEAGQLTKEWNHAGRGRSRPDHIAMDNVSIPFGDVFHMPDGARMKYPGDPAGGAANTVNCRCTVSHSLA